MDYLEAVDRLSPDLVRSLRSAVETGRWPDGRPVTPEQREHSLQAVIAWERKHLPERERVGFIDRGRKGPAAGSCSGDDTPEESTLRWADDRGAGPA